MHDLPTVTVQQQAHARPIDAEDLEVMGKAAAAKYHCGEYSTLDEAVVETVKKAGLSPEQVKRVIEFTNVNAHLSAFNKEADHKFISFEGGPASPSVVLKDLNDGGGGTVFDRGTADYNYPPPDVEKTSSANMSRLGFIETKLAEAFKVEEKHYPFADPLKEAWDLKEKLAGSRDLINHDLSAHETIFLDVGNLLYNEVKQAAMEGTSLGKMVQAWSTVTSEPTFMKVAFQSLTPRLLREGVFDNKDELSASIGDFEKTAALVNPKHPLVGTFADYCEVLTKLAQLRQAREECDHYFDALTEFLKEAKGGLATRAAGLVPKALRLAEEAAVPSGKAGRWVGEKLLGAGKGAERIAKGTEVAVKHMPHALGLLAAEEGYQRARYNPVIRGAKNFLMSRVPYTRQNLIRQYSMQS